MIQRTYSMAMTFALINVSLATWIFAPVAVAQESDDHQSVLSFLTEVAQEIKANDTKSLSEKFFSSVIEELEKRQGFEQAISQASATLTRLHPHSEVKVEIHKIEQIEGKFHVEASIGGLEVRPLVIAEVDGRMSFMVLQSPTRKKYRIRNYTSGTVTAGCDNWKEEIEPRKARVFECKDNGCSYWFFATFLRNFTHGTRASCYWQRATDDATVEPPYGRVSCTQTCG